MNGVFLDFLSSFFRRAANKRVDGNHKACLSMAHETIAAPVSRPRVRSRRTAGEFHRRRAGIGDDPGGGQLSGEVAGGAAGHQPVPAGGTESGADRQGEGEGGGPGAWLRSEARRVGEGWVGPVSNRG